MSNETLITLLQKYVDRTGHAACYSYEVRISKTGVSKEYCVFLHEGSQIKHSILFTTLENAIEWTQEMVGKYESEI